MADQGTFDFGPDVPRSGVALKRDFHGFAQFREDEHSPWVFYVCGFDSTFSGEAGQCTVLRVDGGQEWVPIDADDRITIAGRKYGRKNWNH